MIVLNAVRFSNFANFHGNMKISQKRANSTVRLEILQPVKNCRP